MWIPVSIQQWYQPLHCGEVLQLILVHVVVWVSHNRLIDDLQQPAALTQCYQYVLLLKHIKGGHL